MEKQRRQMKVEFDDTTGSWSIDEGKIDELVNQKVAAKKRSIDPSKLFIALLIVGSFTTLAIIVPPSRVLLGLIVFFGFMPFLNWLDK